MLIDRLRTTASATALLVTALLSTALLVTPLTAHAVEPAATGEAVSWGVRPADNETHGAGRPNYAYAVEPGEVVDDALVISNYGTADIALRVYAADAFTTADGALDLLLPDEPSTDVGRWTRAAEPEVVVPAGETREVPFTITVPQNATPGDHAGGIVTSLVAARAADGITVDRRLGSRMHLRVAGALAPALSIESFSVEHLGELNPIAAGRAQARITLANTGNARLSGDVTFSVAGPFGIAPVQATAQLAELLPGDRRELQLVLDGVLPLLWLGAELSVQPVVAGADTGVQLDAVLASTVVPAIPWSLLALLVLVALAVVVVVWLRRRGKAAAERKVTAAVAAALAAALPEGEAEALADGGHGGEPGSAAPARIASESATSESATSESAARSSSASPEGARGGIADRADEAVAEVPSRS